MANRSTVANPKAARKMGVGMVFQHFSLFEAMTVLENIALGMDGGMSQSELETKIRQVLQHYDLTLDPHRVVSTLSVGERQRIEIVRALLLEPELLIMDEPTSVLTPQEVAQLFDTLRKLSARGCSILYISHKLHEIRDLCDGGDHPARRPRWWATAIRARRRTTSMAGDDDRRQPQADRARRYSREFGEARFVADGLIRCRRRRFRRRAR